MCFLHLRALLAILKETVFTFAAVQIAFLTLDSFQTSFACWQIKMLLELIYTEIRAVIATMRIAKAMLMVSFHDVPSFVISSIRM